MEEGDVDGGKGCGTDRSGVHRGGKDEDGSVGVQESVEDGDGGRDDDDSEVEMGMDCLGKGRCVNPG